MFRKVGGPCVYLGEKGGSVSGKSVTQQSGLPKTDVMDGEASACWTRSQKCGGARLLGLSTTVMANKEGVGEQEVKDYPTPGQICRGGDKPKGPGIRVRGGKSAPNGQGKGRHTTMGKKFCLR